MSEPSTGLSETEYVNEIRWVAFEYLLKPMVILLGMVIAGAIMDTVVHTDGWVLKAFVGVGGVGAIAEYFLDPFRKPPKFDVCGDCLGKMLQCQSLLPGHVVRLTMRDKCQRKHGQQEERSTAP